jgi:hypothetical protein
MTNPERLNQQLKAEIDSILNKSNLLQIISKYGTPLIVGSYAYDLLVWKDFDINLTIKNFAAANIQSLIKELSQALSPKKIHTHDNMLKQQANRPKGIWVGIFLKEGWKIDLWLLSEEETTKKSTEFAKLCAQIAASDKDAILRIKTKVVKHPDYHVKFSSVDIYNAVAGGNVTNIRDFQNWLKKERDLDYTF